MHKEKGSAFIYGVLKAALFVLYKVFFRLKCRGSEQVPSEWEKRGVILASNHESFLDPPLFGVAVDRRVTFLAKEYLFKAFFVGAVLRSVGAFPIKTRADDFRSIRSLIRILKDGACVLVFPEGTRSPDGQFQEPEGGIGFLAAKSGAFVVPAHISGTYEAFPRQARFFRFSPLTVVFGKPFIPAEDKDLMGASDPNMAVSRRIMDEIKKLKEESE
ncbi:MAG: 1-acyl-sn-glycerol-3-phosphate acyltransferase [Candidatus Omnitrophica bacterium]|nr:1-acyl-sn-glycerol-3-phosphate acyltransferase [Candidatus Omnitrophota bacterium]